MKAKPTIVLIEGESLPDDLAGLLAQLGAVATTTWSSGLREVLDHVEASLLVCGDPSHLPRIERAMKEAQLRIPLLLISDWDLQRADRAMRSGLVDDIIPDSLPSAAIAQRLHSLASRVASRRSGQSTFPEGPTGSTFPPASPSAPPSSHQSGVRQSPVPVEPGRRTNTSQFPPPLPASARLSAPPQSGRPAPPSFPPSRAPEPLSSDPRSSAQPPKRSSSATRRIDSRLARSSDASSRPPREWSPNDEVTAVTSFPPPSRIPRLGATTPLSTPPPPPKRPAKPSSSLTEPTHPSAVARGPTSAARPHRSTVPPPLPRRSPAPSSQRPSGPTSRPAHVPAGGTLPSGWPQRSAPSSAPPFSRPPPTRLPHPRHQSSGPAPALTPSTPAASSSPTNGWSDGSHSAAPPAPRRMPAGGRELTSSAPPAFAPPVALSPKPPYPLARPLSSSRPPPSSQWGNAARAAYSQPPPAHSVPASFPSPFAPAPQLGSFPQRERQTQTPVSQSRISPRRARGRKSSLSLAIMALGGGAALSAGFFTARALEEGTLRNDLTTALRGTLELLPAEWNTASWIPAEPDLSPERPSTSLQGAKQRNSPNQPLGGPPPESPAAAAEGNSAKKHSSGSRRPEGQQAPDPGSSPNNALALSDLASSETSAISGMTHRQEQELFVIRDSNQPKCDELLGQWQPELPLIEEERPVRSLQHKHQAQSYLMTGREQDARSELCKAVKIDPGGPAAELLAGLYLSQRSLSNAEAVLRPVLVSDPESKSGLELLGDILNQKGDLSGAKRLWLQVLKVDADETGVLLDISRRWVTSAIGALKGRDVPRAERLLRRALTFDPQNASAAFLMAKVLGREGERAASRAWSKRAREID